MTNKYIKKKKKINSYSYRRNGKKVNVKAHKRTYKMKNPKLRKGELISLEKAKAAHEKRAERAQSMDEARNAKPMYAVPTSKWLEAYNRYDIWGLDGFDAPEVKNLPITGDPYQVVKYNNEIYQADKTGKFIRTGLKVVELDPSNKVNQTRFEQETGKNAVWNDRYTNAYADWLEDNKSIERVAHRLSYDLEEDTIDELYDRLNLFHKLKDTHTEQEVREILIEAYNNTHKQDAKSYTKGVQKWREHAYQNAVTRAINEIKNESKKRTKDPYRAKKSRKTYYTPESPLLISNISSILDSKGFHYVSENDIKEWLHGAGFAENKKTSDFAVQYIEERLKSKNEYGAVVSENEELFINDQKQMQQLRENELHYAQQEWYNEADYLQNKHGDISEAKLEAKLGPFPESIEDIEPEDYKIPSSETELTEQVIEVEALFQ